jgi:hypothetical protein
MSDCTEYVWDDDLDYSDHHTPCQCPVCKGWLKWEEKDGEHIPICNKCHTPLIAIPDKESDEDSEWGKICALKPLTDAPKQTEGT